MSKSRKHEIGVGLLLVVATLALGWLSLRVGALEGFRDRVHVTLYADDVSGLRTGAPIAVAGVEVGAITSMRVEGGRAVAELAVDPEARLRTDVRTRVRARSILGEKFLMMLPQSDAAPLLQDGDVLELSQAQIDIDQVVDTLGPVLAAINAEAFAASVDALTADPARWGKLLDDVSRISARGVEVADQLPDLIARADTTLGRVDAAVARLDRTARRLEAPLDDATATLRSVRTAMEPVPALVDDGAALMDDLRVWLDTLDGSTDEVERILANLAEIDKWELRRLLREEGILLRIFKKRVKVPATEGDEHALVDGMSGDPLEYCSVGAGHGHDRAGASLADRGSRIEALPR